MCLSRLRLLLLVLVLEFEFEDWVGIDRCEDLEGTAKMAIECEMHSESVCVELLVGH